MAASRSAVAAAVLALAGAATSVTADAGPPSFGAQWTGRVSANLTQVGYDAGLVIVNFSSSCDTYPHSQRSKTVYGDFYTVLLRCDLGLEFTVAPASRGGACSTRIIGVDTNVRICAACGCPFCVRDTNSTWSHSEGVNGTTTKWDPPTTFRDIDGTDLTLYKGVAVSESASTDYALQTTVAFNADHLPVLINVSHPLWMTTAARIEDFSSTLPKDVFNIPDDCKLPAGYHGDGEQL